MKTSQKALLALITGCFLSVSAQAAMSYGNGQPYIGAKVGKFMLDDDGLDSLDDATAYGVYGGYNFTPNVGVEVEYVGSSDADVSLDGFNAEYNVKTYGAYGTYRYQFPNTALYAKGKLGIAKVETEVSFLGYSESGSDTGIAGGLGLGYVVNPNVAIEAEYAMMQGDADANLLTVGANFKF
ncbi:porin family protein [Psychrobacter urativorans]|uniref:Cell envelope biogenesis protein OmpA n=1 Tax=Psychrobacter urativorans TaxID=45610 RepID=A0A0M4U5H2_9GAMM|nr:porin family protein [Psychrobacter urativorans]ALF60181.1 cell envelope biogenesis protein OmpA [Psychrobacter urativorans]